MSDERILSSSVNEADQAHVPLAKLREVALLDPTLRFSLELEFIEMLANPSYLNYLADQRYFENSSFVHYIKYLQYWRQPEYIVFISYPHALFFLDMLQYAPFRAKLIDPGFIRYLADNQYAHSKWWRHNRAFERMAEAEQQIQWLLAQESVPETRDQNP